MATLGNVFGGAPSVTQSVTMHRVPSPLAAGISSSSKLRCVTVRTSNRSNGMPIPKSLVQEDVALFVRMLGLDKPVETREEAVDALWRLCEGGKDNVDEIIKFSGCLNLVVTLVSSTASPDASEAAAGLLRQVASFEGYRLLVAEAGAIEEITCLLARKSASVEIREQAIHALWNLSAEEKLRDKIANVELLPVLVAMLDSEEQTEQAAAAGIFSNLASSEGLHNLLLQTGIIPKMASLLKADLQKVSKAARQEARTALLELSRNPVAKNSVLEEGLIFVPIIGADAYESLKPHMEVKPYVPESIKLDNALGSRESDFGAGDVLLGLKVGNAEHDVDEATQLVMEGRVRLRFLSRVGLLGKETTSKRKEAVNQTVMPWWDAVPRLVLILGLEDVTYARKAARSIADAAINEEIRQAFAKAGAIPHLVYLLGTGDETAMEATAHAIEQLSASHKVRGAINNFGAIPPLVAILNAENVDHSLQTKVLGALARLSQTPEEVEAMVQSGSVLGIMAIVNSEDATYEAKVEAQNVLKELSSLKADPRDKIAESGGIPSLIRCLKGPSLACKEKAAIVLENMSAKEVHAISIAQAGVDAALKSSFVVNCEEGIQADLVMCTSTRLLGKLLNFELARKLLDCPSYVLLLSDILKMESVPLYVKNWVSSCLLKLSKFTEMVDIPVNLEVNIHDVIPRLLQEIKSGSASVQETAIVKLHDLVVSGVPDYVATIARTPGGIFSIVAALEKGSLAARVAAVPILYGLGMNEENHAAIVAAGAVPFLERLVRIEAGEWRLALELLRLLPV